MIPEVWQTEVSAILLGSVNEHVSLQLRKLIAEGMAKNMEGLLLIW